MKLPHYLFCMALVLLLAGGCRAGDADPAASSVVTGIPTLVPQRVATGKDIYAIHCAVCHGENLEGEADWKLQNADGSFRSPPHDASGHTWHHSDDQLIDAVRLGGARLPADVGGTSAMPAYKSILTTQEIVAVLEFIKSTWPEEQRLYQWERNRAAQP